LIDGPFSPRCRLAFLVSDSSPYESGSLRERVFWVSSPFSSSKRIYARPLRDDIMPASFHLDGPDRAAENFQFAPSANVSSFFKSVRIRALRVAGFPTLSFSRFLFAVLIVSSDQLQCYSNPAFFLCRGATAAGRRLPPRTSPPSRNPHTS